MDRRRGPLSSFTLVELLIVIAILAILAAAVVIVLNPAELLAQSRDTQRTSDLKTLNDAVNLFIIDNPTASLGAANTVYISLPDTAAGNCSGVSGLPTLPAGWSYHCVTAANLRDISGNGWLPLNFSSIKGGSPMPYAPIDPVNTTASSFYYLYIPGTSTFEVVSLLESERQTKALSAKDGGADPSRFEVGSDISLWPGIMGLIAYWSFDEGSGGTAYDTSGKNNNGTITGPTYGLDRFGVAGKALAFDGADDFVSVADSADMRMTTGGTFAFWVYQTSMTSSPRIIDKSTDTSSTNGYFFFLNGKANVRANGSSDASSGNNTPPLNTWSFLVATFDASGKKVYMNGADVTASGGSNTVLPPNVAGEIRVGNRAGATDRPFAGRMDDSRVFNRALSANEVRSLYLATK